VIVRGQVADERRLVGPVARIALLVGDEEDDVRLRGDAAILSSAKVRR